MIDANRVEELLMECLSEEGSVIEGIVNNFGISRDQAQKHRQEIVDMLLQLPDQFFDDTGGGWSFLNLCQTANGDLWTGFQTVAEVLFCLASALGLAAFLMPRTMWPAFPGGMPYIVFYRSKFYPN